MVVINKIEIESYGGIKGRTLELAPGLNVIEAPNEWGKSTTVSFVKFVLYGLPKIKKKVPLSAYERQRMTPWDGSPMAGALEVTADGADYRIYRQTGERREKIRVTDLHSGEPYDLAGRQPGELLFGLDAGSFERTLLTSQSGIAVDEHGALEIKIRNLATSGEEDVSYDRTVMALEKAQKQYRHKGRSTGGLYDLKAELAAEKREYERSVAGYDHYIEAAELARQTREQLAESERAASELTSRVGESEAADAAVRLERIAALEQERDETVCALRLVGDVMEKPALLEAEHGLYRARSAVEETKRLAARVEEVEREAERAAALLTATADKRGAVDTVEGDTAGIRAYEGTEKTPQPQERRAHSPADGRGKTVPGAAEKRRSPWPDGAEVGAGETEARDAHDSQEMDRAQRTAGASGTADTAVTSKSAAADEEIEAAIRTVRKGDGLAILLGGAALIVTGVVVAALAFALWTPGIWAIFLLPILAGVGLILLGLSRRRSYREVLARFGTAQETALLRLAADLHAAEQTRAVQEAEYDRVRAVAEELRREQSLKEAEADRFVKAVTAVCGDADSLGAAERWLVRERERAAECDALRRKLDLLEERLSAAGAAEREKLEQLAADYRGGEAKGAGELREQLAARQSEMSRLREQLTRAEEEMLRYKTSSRLPTEVEANTTRLSAVLERARQEDAALSLAGELLAAAYQRVQARFAPELNAKAAAYFEAVTAGKYGRLQIDHQYRITIFQEGDYHDIGYFSAGTQDAAYLALRLAVTELLFPEELPPAFFDDSFTRLDDERCTALFALLRESRRQLVIFTCGGREKALEGANSHK